MNSHVFFNWTELSISINKIEKCNIQFLKIREGMKCNASHQHTFHEAIELLDIYEFYFHFFRDS